ncbi:hypothetical protein AgCh_024052 [Apium graveolens]
MEQNNHIFSNDYFLESFNGGLKSVVKPFVNAFKPTAVTEAIRYARLHEESIVATQKYSKFSRVGTNSGTYASKTISSTVFASNANKPPLPPTLQTKHASAGYKKQVIKPFQFIPAEVRAEKLVKVEENWDIEEESEEEVEECVIKDSDPCISVSALTGSQTFSKMRVMALVLNKLFHILVDYGSTHNFLDIAMNKKLKCKISATNSQEITVANRNSITYQHVIKDFSWRMGGYNFTSEVMLIDLGSCDMGLGV